MSLISSYQVYEMLLRLETKIWMITTVTAIRKAIIQLITDTAISLPDINSNVIK